MAAETYRPNPRFSTEDAIREVGSWCRGEAVTSMLQKAQGSCAGAGYERARSSARHRRSRRADQRCRFYRARQVHLGAESFGEAMTKWWY